MSKTREQWLQAAGRRLRPRFERAGFPIPENVRVSCGWPSSHATSRSHRRVGECWAPKHSTDGVHEVFVSPTLDGAADGGVEVMAVLAHELAHAAVGVAEGHKGAFVRCMRAVGLEGKPTATHAGADLTAWCVSASKTLGPYPHGRLAPTQRDKVQTTRMLKVSCRECGYVCRVTRFWLDGVGAPLCPCNSEPMTEEG